ncbi:MAG: protein kinase [Blastocatellia bacterium]|nr:protein kinase [Blastocatellia bacterium]
MNISTRTQLENSRSYVQIKDIEKSLNQEWQELTSVYLPMVSEDLKWRCSRRPASADPEQGWKIHVSATLLTANTVLEKVAPLLKNRAVLFKTPYSLEELDKINSGVHYGYSQVGKFITVYPRSDEEALFLASELHNLTSGIAAPTIPFDTQLQPESCVYYRYGAFGDLEIKNPDGSVTSAIRTPEGNLIADLRDSCTTPDWVSDPFIEAGLHKKAKKSTSPLNTTFRAFRALAQRGKGGVYQAIDLRGKSPRLCVIKEGRRNGETCWDGRDGYWRVAHEEQVLRSLHASGVTVPSLYTSFEANGNYYVVMESVDGENLELLLKKRARRLSIIQVMKYAVEIAEILSQIHAAGWIWRDCKPSNFIRTRSGSLVPCDFEGAVTTGGFDTMTWDTPIFSSPESQYINSETIETSADIYSLGAVVYFLLTGRYVSASSEVSIKNLRPKVPQYICNLVLEFLSSNPKQRPSAEIAAKKLKEAIIFYC